MQTEILPPRFWQKWQAMFLIVLVMLSFLGHDLYMTYLRDLKLKDQLLISSAEFVEDFYGKAAIYLVFSVLLCTTLLLTQRSWRNQYQAALKIAEQIVSDLHIQVQETDQANAESNALRQALLDNSAVGIILATQNRIVDQVSHRMCQMFGYAPEDILQHTTEVIHVDREHFERFQENYTRLLKEPIVGAEYPFRHRDGRIFWCSVTGTALDPNNLSKGIIWSFLDIDDRRRLAQEVENQKRSLADILNSIPAAVSYWDTQDIYNIFNVFSNKAYTDWYETTSEALVGMHVRDLLGEKVYTANWHRMVRASQGETLVYDRVQPSINGQPPRHAQIHYIPNIRDGRTLGLYVMMFDTTAIRHSELEMKLAKEVAENATKAKSEFLANMSHEIRTPMNAIIGLTNRALETELTPKQQDYLTKVHNAAVALLRLLNDILDHSKIEAGRMTIEQLPFPLMQPIRDIEDLFTARIEEKHLSWKVGVAPDVPECLIGDPLRLGQVLINLVANAIKFTDQGQISLQVTRVSENADSVKLRVSVEDTGIGMSEEQCAVVFGSFTQADNSITRKYGGTGLGLSISKQLVELMGGEINVTSQLGKGSCFSFTLVCTKVALAQELPIKEWGGSVPSKPENVINPLSYSGGDSSNVRELDQEEERAVAKLLAELRLRLGENKFVSREIAEHVEKMLEGTVYARPFSAVVRSTRKLKFKNALFELEDFPDFPHE